MFSLSLREQTLVAAVILAVVLGVSVKHWRDAQRESAATRPAADAPVVSTASFPPSPRASGPRASSLP